jgi:hypothetical protein
MQAQQQLLSCTCDSAMLSVTILKPSTLCTLLTTAIDTQPHPEDARQCRIKSPILNAAELSAMCSDIPDFSVQKLSTLYDISTGPAGLTDVSVTRHWAV